MNIIEEVVSHIRKTSTLVVDCETTGLDWRTDKSCGYVLTFGPRPEETFYLPIGHATGNLDRGQVLDMLQTEIHARGTEPRVVFHNGAFDLDFTSNDWIQFLGPLEDTMVNAFLINEHAQGNFSLDTCCKFMGVQEKKGDELYKYMAAKFKGEPTRRAQMGNFWQLDGADPIGVDYARGDGTSTWQLWEAQQGELDAQNLRNIWQIECRVIRVLHRMKRRGIKVDEERLARVTVMVDAYTERLRAGFKEGFNLDSKADLIPYFNSHGITELPKTAPSKKFPEGQVSITSPWMAGNEPGRKIVAVKQLEHLMGTFIVPLRDRHLYKGRVHANFNQTMGEEFGTVTGRLSCNNPNMQQIPKRNKELGPVFRSVFVPDDGMIWASCDYSQCEPRLLAHYGQVKVLLDGFKATPFVDAHQAVATAAGIDREPGKRINQALLTGGGMGRMMELLAEYGADPSEASRIMKNYFEAMPEIKPFQKKAANVFQGRGYIISLLGRRARLDDPRFAYRAVNRLLQVGNADINKKALADVDEYYASEGDVTHLINDVHDDLCNQFLPENRPQLDRAVQLMEDYGPGRSVHVDVPMVVDVGTGKNWAEASYKMKDVVEAFRLMGEEYK